MCNTIVANHLTSLILELVHTRCQLSLPQFNIILKIKVDQLLMRKVLEIWSLHQKLAMPLSNNQYDENTKDMEDANKNDEENQDEGISSLALQIVSA